MGRVKHGKIRLVDGWMDDRFACLLVGFGGRAFVASLRCIPRRRVE